MAQSLPQPGDILAFTGSDWVSNVINIGSLGIPLVGISHVAIVGPDGLIYESTGMGGRPPCTRQGRLVKGFQCHELAELLELPYKAIWHYPLRCPLYPHEQRRLKKELDKLLGTPYDYKGAGKSGGGLLCQLATHILGRENMSSVFCSESVAYLEVKIGRFWTKNSGAWNPNSLIRTMRRTGSLEPPIKIGPLE